MPTNSIKLTPIGFIRTPFKNLQGMPIQPGGAQGIRGTLTLAPEYTCGLMDLEGFSHVYLIYHFHKATLQELIVNPSWIQHSLRPARQNVPTQSDSPL